MEKVKRILMAAMMCCIVSAGAFAQKQDPKPPPKEPDNQPKVTVPENKNPPQQDRNQGNSDKKKP